MKMAILAAGKSDFFPIFIDRPKCLYHLNGKIQLERVIEDCLKIVPEENIIVVAGYKYKKIEKFLIACSCSFGRKKWKILIVSFCY